MKLPEGRLLRSRVVADPSTALASALDRELTGYALLEPQDALLLDADDAGVILFQGGVPTAAHHAGTGRGGPAALADLAVPGPYNLELRALDPDGVAAIPTEGRRVPPGMPAERLGGDADLATRTRTAASRRTRLSVDGPDADPAASSAHDPGEPRPTADTDDSRDVGAESDPEDAVAAFLDDEEKIDAIRRQARERVHEQAAEWGLEDHLE